VALIVLALNWFNPIAWIAFRAFRADQELSCDAAIAAEASPETRCDYARALVKSASRPGRARATARSRGGSGL
jgi:beta-lactamase regulating signal transducer with metallopeptidase domain